LPCRLPCRNGEIVQVFEFESMLLKKIEICQGTEVDLIVGDDHTLNVVPKRKKPTQVESVIYAETRPLSGIVLHHLI
jgi:hypothetical protein